MKEMLPISVRSFKCAIQVTVPAFSGVTGLGVFGAIYKLPVDLAFVYVSKDYKLTLNTS